jgi:1-pyrroline-5-carboxylate dehydrogenase
MHHSPEKQPFKQLILNVEFKIDVPYTSEAKKLEPEIQNMTAPHDHKHIVGTYHLAENLMWSKQLQMH